MRRDIPGCVNKGLSVAYTPPYHTIQTFQIESDGAVDPHWERFASYAVRVRRLEHIDFDTKGWRGYQALSPEVVSFLLTSTPPEYQPLLPALRKIDWVVRLDVGTLEHIAPFLSTSLQKISLHIKPHGDLAPGISRIIAALRAVPTLHLSQFFIDSSTPQGLSEDLGAFLATQAGLTHLVLGPLLAKEDKLIRQIACLRDLRTLSIRLAVDSLEELSAALTILVDGCTLVQRLTLRPRLQWILPGPVPVSAAYSIPFATINPILRWRNLQKLNLSWEHGFGIETHDVIEMGRTWRSIESLSLNHVGNHSIGLPISLLPVFAETFPASLTYLALSLKVYSSPSSEASLPRFPSLETFYLGPPTSIREDLETETAQVLAQLCPPGIFIRTEGASLLDDMTRMVSELHRRERGGAETI